MNGGHLGGQGCSLAGHLFVKPALVLSFREASPFWAQTEINSVKDANKNWELVLAAIFTTIVTKDQMPL